MKKPIEVKSPQLSFPELTFLNGAREEVFLDLLGQSIRNTKFLRTRVQSSELPESVKLSVADSSTESLAWMGHLFFQTSRYSDKYKSHTKAQIHATSTITPDHILYASVPNPTDPEELLEWYMRQEARINGLLLGYKDFVKGREETVKGITQNLRRSTIILNQNVL